MFLPLQNTITPVSTPRKYKNSIVLYEFIPLYGSLSEKPGVPLLTFCLYFCCCGGSCLPDVRRDLFKACLSICLVRDCFCFTSYNYTMGYCIGNLVKKARGLLYHTSLCQKPNVSVVQVIITAYLSCAHANRVPFSFDFSISTSCLKRFSVLKKAEQ